MTKESMGRCLSDQLDFVNCNAPSAPFSSLSPRLVDAVLLLVPFGMEGKIAFLKDFIPEVNFPA
jgi:hypothetical protein